MLGYRYAYYLWSDFYNTRDELLYAQKLYESPMTLVLRGEGPHLKVLGKAIDNAKLNGFTIDAVTVFTETSLLHT